MYIATICLLSLASVNIIVGSKLRMWRDDIKIGQKTIKKTDESTDESNEGDSSVDLNIYHVLTFPFTSSIFLVLIFYFFSFLQYFLVFLVIIAGFISVQVCCSNMLSIFLKKSSHAGDNDSSITVATYFLSAIILIEWIRTGNFILHDIISSCLCILFISIIRFPSLRLAVSCLTILFFYDIYWVFFSKYHFNKNVMVEVSYDDDINQYIMIVY